MEIALDLQPEDLISDLGINRVVTFSKSIDHPVKFKLSLITHASVHRSTGCVFTNIFWYLSEINYKY